MIRTIAAASPRIALTMGDAGGVGPELVCKVLSAPAAPAFAPVVIGDLEVMRRAAELAPGPVRFRAADAGELAAWRGDEVPVVCPDGVDVAGVAWGETGVRSGVAAGACLTEAFRLALAGRVDGVLSAPLSKESFHLAGYTQLDELAYLGELTGSQPFLVGVADGVWTAAVTLHTPLRDVADLVTRAHVLRSIEELDGALRRAGSERPAIAVAGLNPHAGEGGLLGREEIDEIAPAIAEARAQGIDATGPVPADTVFVRAFRGEFAGVVCMYHDQANIARKLRGFAGGATLFLGLPVACGTTAHGTAFDVAGTGVADPGSLARALSLVVALSATRAEPATPGTA
jgi:4-hydroxythreonine-4-phosphate dehydrogenase